MEKMKQAWPGEAPAIQPEMIARRVEKDIIVVGGSHAGIHCALAASEGGSSVAVLEKQKREKMHWFGEQIGTFNSKFLTERGCGNYDLDEVIEEFCRCGNYYNDRELIAKYVKNSGEALDHLLSLVPADSTLLRDDQYNIQVGYGNPSYPVITGGYKSWAGTIIFRGTLLTERDQHIPVNGTSRLPELCWLALKESERLGAEWFFGQTAVVLTKEGDRVTGVITKDSDGGYTHFVARKGVVLATGNFTDSGFKLGVWAGGHMDNTPFEPYQMVNGHENIQIFGTTPFLKLNAHGRRFRNESVPYGNAAGRQPSGGISWVTDKKWTEQIKTAGLFHGAPDFGVPLYIEQCKEDMSHVVEHGAEGYEVRNCALSEREQVVVYGAETLDTLADYLGYRGEDKQRFLESVARYNEMCYQHHDDDFGKDVEALLPIDEAPFFGSTGYPADIHGKPNSGVKQFGELAGLHCSADMQVLDSDNEPILGLYAVGNCLGFLRSVFYATPVAGNFIGMAMTHGRVLGKYLANSSL